tara:strand:+ start:866 stop:1525 length:660 start_codon:yes stop_codon:yes gene_type:complete
MYSNNFYEQYNYNIYSQNGEDGVIEELLNRLNITNGWVCEFGAWDGKHLSNTFNLVKNKQFKAIFIEGDNDKYNDLLKTVNEFSTIVPIKAYVDYNDTQHSLDNLLKNTDIPNDFDILSIDIDSFDYQIWKSVKAYKPKIVIIEINSSVKVNDSQWIHTQNRYQGTGFKPTYDLGIEKGYKFVLHTGNMFFVREDLFDKLDITYDNPLENFRTDWGGAI